MKKLFLTAVTIFLSGLTFSQPFHYKMKPIGGKIEIQKTNVSYSFPKSEMVNYKNNIKEKSNVIGAELFVLPIEIIVNNPMINSKNYKTKQSYFSVKNTSPNKKENEKEKLISLK